MKYCVLFAIGLFSFSAYTLENFDKSAAKTTLCESVAKKYQAKKFSTNIFDMLVVKKEACLEGDLALKESAYKSLGSKKYLVEMTLKMLVDGDVLCQTVATRSISVTLDKKDQPVINVSKWSVDDNLLECEVQVSDSVAKAQLGDRNVVELEQGEKGLFFPEYYDLGEPDDGGGSCEYREYKVLNPTTKKTEGYMASYLYVNDEGEWSTRYVFRYSVNKKLATQFVEADKSNADYEDAHNVCLAEDE